MMKRSHELILTELFNSTHKVNSSAGSQDQDEPDLIEGYVLPVQEVSTCVCEFHL